MFVQNKNNMNPIDFLIDEFKYKLNVNLEETLEGRWIVEQARKIQEEYA